MKTDRAIHKSQAETQTDSTFEISKVAVTAVSITAGFIGLWAVACMVSGIFNSGGPVALVQSFFGAASRTM